MAGRGPAPKDPRKRARSNSDPVPLRVVQVKRMGQPALEDVLGDLNPLTGKAWLRATLQLWGELADHPATGDLVAAQWSQLARAMMYDDAAITGRVAPNESRLRFAKFFIDPDDMMRGRIVAAHADEAETKRRTRQGTAARKRYGGASRAVASA